MTDLISSQTYGIGEQFQLSSISSDLHWNEFTGTELSDYDFKYWTKTSADQEPYITDSQVTSFSDVSSDLYAQWERVWFNLTYAKNSFDLAMYSINGVQYEFDAAQISNPFKYTTTGDTVYQPFSLCPEISSKLSVCDVCDNAGIVSSLYKQSFYGCENLSSVSFNSVTTIGQQCFQGCNKLQHIQCSSVISMGIQSFYQCNALTSIDCPVVSSIGSSSFYRCLKLQNANLPYLTAVDYNTFYACSTLSSINIKNAKSVGQGSFQSCKMLTSINCPNVTSIGSKAFYMCTTLSSVILSNMPQENITTVNSDSFGEIYHVVSVYVPYGMREKIRENNETWKTLEDNGTIQLVDIDAAVIMTSTSGKAYPFLYSDVSSRLKYTDGTSVVSPFSLNSELSVKTNLKKVESTVNVLSVSSHSFKNCSSLEQIYLPSVRVLQDNSFENCSSLISVNIPSVGRLGNYVFDGCDNLQSLSIPQLSVAESIYPFGESLTSLYIPNTWMFGQDTLYFKGIQEIVLSDASYIKTYDDGEWIGHNECTINMYINKDCQYFPDVWAQYEDDKLNIIRC